MPVANVLELSGESGLQVEWIKKLGVCEWVGRVIDFLSVKYCVSSFLLLCVLLVRY